MADLFVKGSFQMLPFRFLRISWIKYGVMLNAWWSGGLVCFSRYRYCSEGKRTFSSRLILEKHIRVRHGIRTRQTIEKRVRKNTSASRNRPQVNAQLLQL